MDTSWQKVSKWYNKSVGEEGHYYHQQVILPNLLRMMALRLGDKVLDIACGQGVLARAIPSNIDYVGFDISGEFIKIARQKAGQKQKFYVADACRKDYGFLETAFSHACVILALQNLELPNVAIVNMAERLTKGGQAFVVINHPFYRIPKASSWGWDSNRKLQYRIVDRYLSSFDTKITAHPGLGKSDDTISFHFSLSEVAKMFFKAGMVVEGMEEWVSDKKSTGGRGRAENISRREIPLFMAIVAKKI